MENLIEFDAEMFSPFGRVFFANQESSGKYPNLIRIDFVRDCFGILSGNWVKEK